MAVSRSRAVVVVLLLVCAMMMAHPADASTFGCEKKWSGPSESNDMGDCDLAQHYAEDKVIIGSLIIPVIIFVLTLILYPIVFCGRLLCNCCGSNRRRPGFCCCGGSDWDGKSDEEKNAAYARSDVICNRVTMFVLWGCAVVALFIMLVGGSRLMTGYNDFFGQIDIMFDWVDGRRESIRSLTTRNGTLIPGMSPDLFINMRSVTDGMRSDISKYKDDTSNYVDIGNGVAIALAIVPNILCIIAVAFAVFDIRKCFPACLTCFFFVSIILYSALALIGLATGVITKDCCGEIDAYKAKQPGLMWWYLVPHCDSTLQFSQFRSQLNSTEQTNALSACQTMLDICSTSTSYNANLSAVRFVCAITNPVLDCQTAADADRILANTYLKAGAPVTCNSSLLCNVKECATSCLLDLMKQKAAASLIGVGNAINTARAYNEFLEPLLHCSALFDKAVSLFTKCDTLQSGLTMIGSGSTLYAFVFCLSIIFLFRGQKRFFKLAKEPSAADEEEDAPAAPAASEMQKIPAVTVTEPTQ